MNESPTIVEQVAIVMQCAHDEIQTVLMYACIAALCAIGVALFATKVCAPAWDACRKFAKLSRIQQFVLAAVAIGFIHYGATKPSVFSYDGGIKANPINVSYTTNDTVHVAWTRDMSGSTYVPLDATVYIDKRLQTDTNGVWLTWAQTTVGAWQYDGTLLDATNYNFTVWAYYIPPEPVHTNGVWLYKTKKDRYERYAIPLRARIEVNGKAIATPKEVRRDEGNE